MDQERHIHERRVAMWGTGRCPCCGIVTDTCDCPETCEYDGACSLPAEWEAELLVRLTEGYELQIAKVGGGTLGKSYVGSWELKLSRYGMPTYATSNYIRMSPVNHFGAAIDAIETLRLLDLVSGSTEYVA